MKLVMDGPIYKITEEDVLKKLAELRHTLPEHATPEKAIYLLEQQHIYYSDLDEMHPDMMRDILKDFENN